VGVGAGVSCIIQLSYSYSAQLVNVLPEVDSGTHHRPYVSLTLNLIIQRKYQSISHPHVFDARAMNLASVTRIRKWDV
jgi:hypothetical protein